MRVRVGQASLSLSLSFIHAKERGWSENNKEKSNDGIHFNTKSHSNSGPFCGFGPGIWQIWRIMRQKNFCDPGKAREEINVVVQLSHLSVRKKRVANSLQFRCFCFAQCDTVTGRLGAKINTESSQHDTKHPLTKWNDGSFISAMVHYLRE